MSNSNLLNQISEASTTEEAKTILGDWIGDLSRLYDQLVVNGKRYDTIDHCEGTEWVRPSVDITRPKLQENEWEPNYVTLKIAEDEPSLALFEPKNQEQEQEQEGDIVATVTSIEVLKPDDTRIGLSQTNSGRADKNPYHLTSEHGCKHGGNIDNASIDLNLVKHANRISTRYWERGAFRDPKLWVRYCRSPEHSDEKTFSINKVLDLLICTHCVSALEFWHTQRRIFLPELADRLDLGSIDSESFEHHNYQEGSCGTCGTPQIVATLTEPASVFDIESPMEICGTCKDLLITSEAQLPIKRLTLSDHPRYRKDTFVVRKPLTDPEYDPYEDHVDDTEHDTLKGLSKQDFIAIVAEFENISEGTARRVYELGITGIYELKEANYTHLEEANFVGRVTARQLRQGAEEHINGYQN